VSIQFESLSAVEVSELLLSYAKGRLSVDERADVDAAAAQSPELHEELEYYKSLASAMEAAPSDDAAPGELGWARLSRALDETDRMEETVATPVGANDNSRGWRYAAMALGLVVMGQFGALFVQQQSADDTARYVPVTSQSAEFSAQITLVPDATEASIRDLLVSVDANIVAGPSALGVYQLGFVDAEARDQGLSTLKEATTVVESASAQ